MFLEVSGKKFNAHYDSVSWTFAIVFPEAPAPSTLKSVNETLIAIILA